MPDRPATAVLAEATLAAARRLGLSNRDLAVVLGTSEASVSRLAHVSVATPGGIDLVEPPFARWRSRLTSKTSYAATQPLGAAMRDEGVEAFRHPSARDAAGGTNIGLFTPSAFASRRPQALQTWHAVATRAHVELVKRDYVERQSFRFAREAFLVRGVLPHPAVA